MVFSNKTHHWAVAMTIDEAIRYAGADGMAARTAHADCTNADVWRASMKTVAYGPPAAGNEVLRATNATTWRLCPLLCSKH